MAIHLAKERNVILFHLIDQRELTEDEGEASPNGIHTACTLTCSVPGALDGIDFAACFDSLCGAEEVEVTVVSEKGQPSYEAEHGAPTADLWRIA